MKSFVFLRSLQGVALCLALAASACVTPRAGASATDSALFSDFLRGRYASLKADSSASAAYYRQALRRAPKDQEILERAVTRTLIAGDVKAAAALETAAARSGQHTALGPLAIATENLAEGRFEAAQKELPITGEMGPFNKTIEQTVRAWAKVGLGDIDGAAGLLKGPGGGSALDRLADYQIGLVYDYAGRNKEAREAYERAWNSGLRLAVDVAAFGALLEREGDYPSAVAIYKEFLSDVGRNPLIETSLARASAKTPASPKIASPSAGAAIAIFGPAAALASQTEGEYAAAYLQLALRLDPNFDAARTLLASGKAEAGRSEDAISALRAVKPDSPYFTPARIEMMWALARLDRNEEALALAKETVVLAPGPETRLSLADLQRSLENWAESEAIYDEEIKNADGGDKEAQARLYFSRGAARERLNRWPEAEADLKMALELAPDDADILNYLGYSWIDRGVNIDKAMGLIERAVALQPESGFIVDSLGWAQYQLGQYEEAAATLENAVELSPGEATINDHLGDAYWRIGRRVEARFQWVRALSLKPTDAERAATAAKLEKGLPDLPAKSVAVKAGQPPVKTER